MSVELIQASLLLSKEKLSPLDRKGKRTQLAKSVELSIQATTVLSMMGSWSDVDKLRNIALSIQGGLADGEPIPKEDVNEYKELIESCIEIYNTALQEEDDVEDEDDLVPDETDKIKKLNETLRDATPSLGLKSLALVQDQLNLNPEPIEEETEEKEDSPYRKVAQDRKLNNEEYLLMGTQFNTLKEYTDSLQKFVPREEGSNYVLISMPVLVVGSVNWKPNAKTKEFLSKNAIEVSGYWLFKNQVVLGVANNTSKLRSCPTFRQDVKAKLIKMYEKDLEQSITEDTPNSVKVRLRNEMKRTIRNELDDEIDSLLRNTNVDSLSKDISKQLGHQVVAMDGVSKIKGSPYTYHWLVSNETSKAVDGVYSKVTGWEVPL